MTAETTVRKDDVSALILGAGEGRRLGGVAKAFLELEGETLLARAIATAAPFSGEIIAAVRAEDVDRAEALVADRDVTIVAGGATFAETFERLLEAATRRIVLQLLVARPFVTADLIARVLSATDQHGAAVVGRPADLRHEYALADGRDLESMLDRDRITLIEGPRAYRRDWLMDALARARQDGWTDITGPDLLRRAGHPVAIVDGDPDNVKITYPEDLGLLDGNDVG